jgi:hypothetical protein
VALVVPIVADTSKLTRGLTQGTSGLRKFGRMAAIVGGAAALGGLVKTLEIGTKKFIAQEKAVAQTNARLKSTGAVANVTAKDIVALSDAIADKTGFDDDQIHAVENMLLTFTKIRNEVGKNNDIFSQATATVVDLSIAFEKDLNSSAIMLGKALNDPVKGITALSRAGVQFTEGQKETIKSLVESGKFLEAQKMILKELESQVGGSGEAFGQTLPGQLSRAKQSFEVVAQTLAATFLPSVANAARKVTDFLSLFAKQPTLQAKIRLVVGGVTDLVGTVYRNLLTWWTTTQRTELPAHIILTPSGRQQFDAFFAGVERDAEKAGRDAIRMLIGAFTSAGRKELGPKLRGVFEKAYSFVEFTHQISGYNAMLRFVKGMLLQVHDLMVGVAQAIVDGLSNALDGMTGSVSGALGNLIQRASKSSRPAFVKAFAVIISNPIKDAIASARASLAGLGTNLGDMLSRITGATSPEAKRAAEIRKQQKLDAAARQKKSLEDAVATAETDDDRRRAQQDLDDFLLDQEAQRLEQVVTDRQAADSLSIDNLIDQFNRGLIGAGEFSSQLDGIIGANRGAELGGAFASAFGASLTALTTEISGIVAGVAGVQAPAGSIVAGGQSQAQQEKNARYQEQLAAWNERRKARLKRAETARQTADSPGGKKITPAERAAINRIMADWDAQPANKKPRPLAMGGILKRQVFTAGEAGPEAVIPLGSNSAMSMLRDAIGGGGGGGASSTYNIVINAGLGTDPDDLGRTIVESIKRYEKRNGAVFQGPIVTTLANAAGKTSTASSATDFNRAKTLRSG